MTKLYTLLPSSVTFDQQLILKSEIVYPGVGAKVEEAGQVVVVVAAQLAAGTWWCLQQSGVLGVNFKSGRISIGLVRIIYYLPVSLR